jgi:hypothetical protein
VDLVSLARQLLEEALAGGVAEKVGKAYVAWVRLTTPAPPTGTQEGAADVRKGEAAQGKGKPAATGYVLDTRGWAGAKVLVAVGPDASLWSRH